MSSTVLEARDLRKNYATDSDVPVRALRGLDLTVAKGEFVAVKGPSGCGKSTLLNVIAGLEAVDGGTIFIGDDEMTRGSKAELAVLRRRHVGIVFQFHNLLDELTLIENVALPSMLAGSKRAPAEARARDLLSLLGIPERRNVSPAVLSGGQRQRLAIARALANEPTILLADEPTGSLDSAGAAEIAALFTRLHKQGQTIIMVTHDDGVASAGSRTVTMSDGRIASVPDSEVTGPVP